MDIAEKLFIKKGYEQTAVSEIVKTAKVAQGTFYYYFKSKEDIINMITDRYISLTVDGMQKIAQEKGPNAVEKLINTFIFSSTFRNNRKSIMKYLHEDRNAHLHLKFERKLPVTTIEPLSIIISQGIKEGIFRTKYPKEAAKAFVGISSMILQGIYNVEPEPEDYKKRLLAMFDFLEKILGTEKNAILNVYKEKGGHYV